MSIRVAARVTQMDATPTSAASQSIKEKTDVLAIHWDEVQGWAALG